DHDHGGHDHDDQDDAVSVYLERLRARMDTSLDQPVPGLQDLTIHFSWGDYWHEERHGNFVETRVDREGWETRVEALHLPAMGIVGVIGFLASGSSVSASGAEAFAPPSDTRRYALFGVEELQLGEMVFVGGFRVERQEVEAQGAGDAYGR